MHEHLDCSCVSCGTVKFFSSVDVEVIPRMIMCVVAFFSLSLFLYSLAFQESTGLVVASFWLGTFTSLLVGKEG